jgi:hypothetical protein
MSAPGGWYQPNMMDTAWTPMRGRYRPTWSASHPDLRTNPDVSHMCARIKFHTYDDLVYRN